MKIIRNQRISCIQGLVLENNNDDSEIVLKYENLLECEKQSSIEVGQYSYHTSNLTINAVKFQI